MVQSSKDYSFFRYVQFITSERQSSSLITPSRFCPVNHLWTDGCLCLFPFQSLLRP